MMLLMDLKLHLRPKTKEFSLKELRGSSHSFLHWLLVALGTILVSAVFSLVGFLLAVNGLIFFRTGPAWFKMMIGLPLFLAGGAMILINLYQLLAAILDRRWSKTHCPFCHPGQI